MASPTIGPRNNFTITLASLANNAARQSAVLDLSGSQPHDVIIGGSLKTASGSLSTSTPYCNVYVYADTDASNYSGGASGSDASYTVPTEWQPKLLGTYRFDAANSAIYIHPTAVARIFGGQVPKKIGLIVHNLSGLALDSSAPGGFNYETVTF